MVIFSIKRLDDSEEPLFYPQRPYHRSFQYRQRRRRNNRRCLRLWHYRRR